MVNRVVLTDPKLAKEFNLMGINFAMEGDEEDPLEYGYEEAYGDLGYEDDLFIDEGFYGEGLSDLELIPLKNTIVRLDSVEDLMNLLVVYERGGWKNDLGEKPTKMRLKYKTFGKVYVDAGHSIIGEGTFSYHNRLACKIFNLDIISKKDFYDIQDLDPNVVDREGNYSKLRNL